jgi:hypothetical protein
VKPLIIFVAVLLLTACASLIDRATSNFADDLEGAIRGYDEPTTVGGGLPAFLLLLEARLQSRPDDVRLRLTTARLTATHAALFPADDDAQRRLSRRALEHARAGACGHADRICGLETLNFEEMEVRVDRFVDADRNPLYVLATTWTGWIDTHSDDFHALADLPRVEMLLEWVAGQDAGHDDGAVWLYLAVLNSQRPPAAGGQPRKAREYFERARAESGGRNLLINVFMADSYARLLFDRDLFVELLEQVLESEIDEPDYRLVNQIARSRARLLLAQTEAIFD